MTEPADGYRLAILSVRPDLADASLIVHTAGWDSDAVEAGDSIFRFPKRPKAVARLRREARLLPLIRPLLPLAVPDLRLHEAPTLFSEHVKIPGDTLETPHYQRLATPQRQALADALAGFYAALHAVPLEVARAAGVELDAAWPPAAEIMALAEATLPPALHDWARRVLAAYDAIPPAAPVLCYLDGHGWNMAFDHARGVLNGLYDFADAGLAPRARDLSLASFVSPDLTDRIVATYRRLVDIPVDPRHVALHTAVQRLAELGAEARERQWFIDNVVQWHDHMQARPDLAV